MKNEVASLMNNDSGVYYNSSEDNNAVALGGDGIHVNATAHQMVADAILDFILDGYSYEVRGN